LIEVTEAVTEAPVSHIPQALHDAFPGDEGALRRLKTDDAHFQTLADQFETLDAEAAKIDAGDEPASDVRAEALKKRRLAVLDEIAVMVAAAPGKEAA
jgi:hypothetical protein